MLAALPTQSLLPATPPYSIRSPSTIIADVDHFRYESLRRPAVDVIVSSEVQRVLGSTAEVATITNAYFRSVHLRLPVLSREHFSESLSISSDLLQADLAVLILVMYLAQQRPQHRGESMQSSLYVTAKMLIGLLEASNYSSLRTVQSRVLLSWYELGHGLFSGASISIGACARAARLIQLHGRSPKTPTDHREAALEEERMRTWCAIRNLDRCVQCTLASAPWLGRPCRTLTHFLCAASSTSATKKRYSEQKILTQTSSYLARTLHGCRM